MSALTSYLLLPQIEVRAANALAGNYAVNAAPIMAIMLFAHNFGRHCIEGGQIQRVAVLLHDAQLLGEGRGHGFYNFHPQQRRGASFINEQDYASSNKHALSLQPTASCHLRLSLLMTTSGALRGDGVPERFLHGARIAGGSLTRHGTLASTHTLDDLNLPTSGYWLVERADLMAPADGRDPLNALCDALGQMPAAADNDGADDAGKALPHSWLAATVLGYAMTTPFARRRGVRMTDDGTTPLHAWCEPLLGLVQYVSRHRHGQRPIPFWRMEWMQDDVFIVTQGEK